MFEFLSTSWFVSVWQMQISPANTMWSMCGWLPMLLLFSLLLHLQFYSTVNVWIPVNKLICECLTNANLTPKYNVVNVWLIANASAIFSAPSCVIVLPCECLNYCQQVDLWVFDKWNLTCKSNVVNVWLIANAFAIFSAPLSPIWLSCECLNSCQQVDLWVFDKCKSHPQMQCGQCAVDCQCFCYFLCSFMSNFIELWMFEFLSTSWLSVWQMQISPANAMWSMCGWLPMLLLFSLLLHVQFYWTVNVWIPVNKLICECLANANLTFKSNVVTEQFLNASSSFRDCK